MNNKLLLVNGITLLYRESQIPGAREKSSGLVRNIATSVKLPEAHIGSVDTEWSVLDGMKRMALAMCDDPPTHEYSPTELLQRIRVVADMESSIYEAFREGIETDLNEMQLKRIVVNLRRTLSNHFREKQIEEIMTRAAAKIRYKREEITDYGAFVAAVCAELEPYQIDGTDEDPAIAEEVIFERRETVEKVFQNVKDMASGESVLMLGWQGINNMYQGGLRPGDSLVIGALQHNGKTKVSLDAFCDISRFNTPVLKDPTKKPLLVRISFEDSVELNLQALYTRLYEEETGKKADINAVDKEVLTDYVVSRMQATGFTIRLLRVDPTQWTYTKMLEKILQYEAEGYEVKLLMCDYLLEMPTTGCKQGATGTDVRDMFRRVRAFCNPRGICFITPHQLSPDAKKMAREAPREFLKKIANLGYWDGCTTIDNVVDAELYIHIEKLNGESYMTFHRGKHRLPTVIEDAEKFCVYKFEAIGGLRADVKGAPQFRRKVGGGVVGSGNEVPVWDDGLGF